MMLLSLHANIVGTSSLKYCHHLSYRKGCTGAFQCVAIVESTFLLGIGVIILNNSTLGRTGMGWGTGLHFLLETCCWYLPDADRKIQN